MDDKIHSQAMIRFEFNSLDDFIRFVEIIRGKETDTNELKELTKDISKSDDALQKAINSQKGK